MSVAVTGATGFIGRHLTAHLVAHGVNVRAIIRPESSHIETTLVGAVRELAPSVRSAIAASAAAQHIKAPVQFAISDIMMRMILRDHTLKLVANTPVEDLSPEIASQDVSERLFRRFKTYLSAVAARETPLVARNGKRSKTATVR